jgi:serpin B
VNFRGIVVIASALLPAVTAGAAGFNAADATNQVGLELYRQLAAGAPGGNPALSPYSIESALALAYTGADGETRSEMARVLHFPAEDQPLQAGFAALRESLASIAVQSLREESLREEQGGHRDVIEWHAANRLYGQQGYPFRAAFLKSLDDAYAAPFGPLDFRQAAENARSLINGWVRDRTRGRIRALVPPGGVDAHTRLVLVNALYLKAPWDRPFERASTADLPFRTASGSVALVPTMRKTAEMRYLRGDGFVAFTLPYSGGDLQLLVLLPDDREGLAALAVKLTPELMRSCAHLGQPRRVALSMPRFRLEGPTIDLARELEGLGMRSAFDEPRGSANFNRAAPRVADDSLYVSRVFHQAFVSVDEEGTEAAAGTAAVMNLAFAQELNPPPPIEVHVDHPFFFAIQDRVTGACLFVGSVSDPR